jgi:mannan endo-1,4-beta-mannosidase
MANQPDPQDFVRRELQPDNTPNLTSLGNQLRFGGVNITWLGLRSDTGRTSDLRTPTAFEITDVFKTVQALGSGYIRSVSLLASAGCALCLTPSAEHTNPDALAYADHILRLARDAGLKIVLPLAGDGHCDAGGSAEPDADTQCVFAAARALPVTGFYTNADVRAVFARHVTSLLNHINPETGIAWKDDATILAWENCDGCGAGIDTEVLADWTEWLGHTIKAVDTRHLYENGAFAGRIGGLDAARLGLPSVDIVGDLVSPAPGAAPDAFAPAQQAVTKAGRVYVIDDYAWTPAHFASESDLDAFFTAIVKNRNVAAAFLSDLSGHADRGGWLPSTSPDHPVLYFPGAPTRQVDLATMEPRARAVRRFDYNMIDIVLPPAFARPPQPQIISVTHGKLVWRGSAGATKYSISRSTDLTETGSWQELCDQCVTDADPSWQDPSVPSGNVWYQIVPFNANLHPGVPSDPAENK